MLRRSFLAAAAGLAPLAGATPKAAELVARVPVWLEGEGAPRLAVRLNGRNARIVRVLGPSGDLVLLLVLDLTGDLTQVEAAREALARQIELLRANELVGVLRAQDGLKVLVDPTSDREAVRAAVSGLTVGGKAGLLDTLEAGGRLADSIARKAAVRVALLYVTDSSVYNYREDFTNPVINSSDSRDLSRRFPEGLVRERVARLEPPMLALETPLFIVHLSYQSDRVGEAYQNGLLELATATGGQATFCRSVAEIPDAVARMFDQIRSFSMVVVGVPAGVRRAVQIQVESEPKAAGYRMRMSLAP